MNNPGFVALARARHSHLAFEPQTRVRVAHLLLSVVNVLGLVLHGGPQKPGTYVFASCVWLSALVKVSCARGSLSCTLLSLTRLLLPLYIALPVYICPSSALANLAHSVLMTTYP
eukprot:13379931-Heterocapsa_arctica.AAC.1